LNAALTYELTGRSAMGSDPGKRDRRAERAFAGGAVMKLTIFAATGGIGRHVLDQAHAAGHDITPVVRDPAKATTLTARIAAPAYRRPISLLSPVRPFPIDERKKPAGNRTAATGTPLRARVSWRPLTLAESARIWQMQRREHQHSGVGRARPSRTSAGRASSGLVRGRSEA
jgi:hypothetical protein